MYRYISIGSDQKVDVYEAKSGTDLFHVNTLKIGIAIILHLYLKFNVTWNM